MKTKTTSLLGTAIAAVALTFSPANAAVDTAPPTNDLSRAETFDRCGTGGYRSSSGGYRSSGSGYRSSGGHYRSSQSYSTRTRSRVIDRNYFHRGCHRYCRITYLHETVCSRGRVLRSWRSSKTVRA